MSAFTMGLTAKGAALYAKAQTGIQLHFTRLVLGDGDLGSNQAINLNALISEKVSLSVTELKVLTGGKAVIGGVMRPEDVVTGFYWKELGLFATDPDAGEILYYYGNAGSQSEWIPPVGSGTLVEKHINVTPIVGNATNVTATIDQSLIYASQQELLAHEKDYSLQIPYAGVASGSANTYTISSPEITSLTAGMAVAVKINVDSTGSSTLNWCGLGAKAIKKANGNNVTNLKAAGIYTLRYDGTNFILQGDGASGNATASDLLSGKTASTDAGDITGTMVNNGPTAAETINLTAQNQEYTIVAGFHTGLRKIKAVITNLAASVIAAGVTVGGIKGTFTSDATAKAATIFAGDTAYINGSKITGTATPKVPNIMIGNNFASTVDWANGGVTFSVASNVATLKATTTNGQIYKTIPVTNGHVYYASANVQASVASKIGFLFNAVCSTLHSGSNAYERLSVRTTATSTSASMVLVDFSISGWTTFYAKEVILIDLTDTFANGVVGTGKEPTQAQMDAIVSANGWWDTSLTLLTADATFTASQLLTGSSGYSNGAKINGTMTKYIVDTAGTAVNGITYPGRLLIRPPQGYWDGAIYTYWDDANFIASNIAKNISIFGRVGTYILTHRPGDNPLVSDDSSVNTQSTSGICSKEWIPQYNGTVRVKFDLYSSSPSYAAYAQIMKGSQGARTAVGTLRSNDTTTHVTYTEDIAVTAGVPIAIKMYQSINTKYCYVSNFSINTDVVVGSVSNTIVAV